MSDTGDTQASHRGFKVIKYLGSKRRLSRWWAGRAADDQVTRSAQMSISAESSSTISVGGVAASRRVELRSLNPLPVNRTTTQVSLCTLPWSMWLLHCIRIGGLSSLT